MNGWIVYLTTFCFFAFSFVVFAFVSLCSFDYAYSQFNVAIMDNHKPLLTRRERKVD